LEVLTGIPRVEKDGLLLQLLGTEWGRKKHGENVRIDAVKHKIAELASRFKEREKYLVIIDDCRFPNEFDAFPEALRVRLTASEDVRKARTVSWRENTKHPSETSLDDREDDFDLLLLTEEPSTPEKCAAVILSALKTFLRG